jgi:hypothetical protein
VTKTFRASPGLWIHSTRRSVTVFSRGEIRSAEQLSEGDWRKTNPRCTGENFKRNLHTASS